MSVETVKFNPNYNTNYKLLTGTFTTTVAAGSGIINATSIVHNSNSPIMFKVYFKIGDGRIYCTPGLFAPTSASTQFYCWGQVKTNALELITANFYSSRLTFNIIYFIYVDRLKG